jgi:hypothetical protein
MLLINRLLTLLGLVTGLVVTTVLAADKPGTGKPELTVENFTKTHSMIKPRPGEAKWMQVPWMTDLWEARKKAAAEGKPLLIFTAGHGHPCGCA